jgi:hypothetical protein
MYRVMQQDYTLDCQVYMCIRFESHHGRQCDADEALEILPIGRNILHL